jgi:signal transduction histidine kinase
MITWLSLSISRKLVASFVTIFFLTYLLTAIFVYTSVRSSMAHSEAQSLAHLANQKLELVSSNLSSLATNLRAWSQLEVMNDIISGDVDKRVARTLMGLKDQYGLSGAIYAFDSQGKLIAATDARSATGGGGLPTQWTNDLKTLRLIDKHQNPFGEGEVVALTIAMHASFSADYKIGTLVLTFPWRSVEAMLIEKDHRIILYTDEKRSVLFASTSATKISAHEVAKFALHSDELQLENSSYVAGYSEKYSSLLNDWHVVALKDARVAYQPIRAVAIKLLVLGLLLAIPIVMAIGWLSRRLTSPVKSLTQVLSNITSSGDLSSRAEIVSVDEFGTLARTFNSMAENLQRSSQDREKFVAELELLNKTLERRVQERTQALESTNQELTGSIESLKTTQAQLVHSEKMASLGQLVAGVAHELNNPIGFIYANFPHLEEYTNDLIELIEVLRNLPMADAQKADVEKKIQEINLDFVKEDILKIIRSGKSGASRIKEIVFSLRSFSRLDEAELKNVMLEDGISDTLDILNHHIKNHIEVIKDFQLNQPVVCRAGQINQVFMNIIYNAIQATEKQDTLRISTQQVGDVAVVKIADSGKGISPEVIGKIFDPFFTTKKVGEGTGLGLSISYGIIKQHGGHLEVSSEVGKGTEFTISIPMQPAPVKSSEESQA